MLYLKFVILNHTYSTQYWPPDTFFDFWGKHILGGGGPLPCPQGVSADVSRKNIFGVGDHFLVVKVPEGSCTVLLLRSRTLVVKQYASFYTIPSQYRKLHTSTINMLYKCCTNTAHILYTYHTNTDANTSDPMYKYRSHTVHIFSQIPYKLVAVQNTYRTDILYISHR